MRSVDVAVIGAGPAGLSAAISARRQGADVLVIEQNPKPGGQLIKQIHKFFGSKEHGAGIRGIRLGESLYQEALCTGVRVWLDASVFGIFDASVLLVARGLLENKSASKYKMHAKSIVLATGASENSVSFAGWTLPGVMGAGAAQTMINVERVLPGKKTLILGSGNVGLIVGYQMLQAGADVVAVCDAQRKIGGYAVHAAKLSRAGVPFRLGFTVSRALGHAGVSAAEITKVDERWKPIPDSTEQFDVDTICIAAGLKPYAKLALMAGCRMVYSGILGGWVPAHDRCMMSSVPGVFVAGDLAGVEEASCAMEEGTLAGLGSARFAGLGEPGEIAELSHRAEKRLRELRMGRFGDHRQHAKNLIVEALSRG